MSQLLLLLLLLWCSCHRGLVDFTLRVLWWARGTQQQHSRGVEFDLVDSRDRPTRAEGLPLVEEGTTCLLSGVLLSVLLCATTHTRGNILPACSARTRQQYVVSRANDTLQKSSLSLL